MIEILAVFVKGRWRLGIGDPTILGWAVTIAYFIAAGLCGMCALRARIKDIEESIVHRPSSFRPSASLCWWALAVFTLLLGFNKQLDLQYLVVDVAQRMSREQGWFAARDAVRKGIILGCAFVFIVLLSWMAWNARRVWRRYVLPVFGVILLVAFVLIRASGNRMTLLGYKPGKFPLYRILEISGIVCIAASAFMELRRSRKRIL